MNSNRGETFTQASTGHRPELAYPLLTEDMVNRLRGYGCEQMIPASTSICAAGTRDVDMYVILEGAIEITARDECGIPQSVATLHAGEFTGELDLFTPRHTLADSRTLVDSRVLRVARPQVKALMGTEGDIANLIMQAAIWRRIGMIESSLSGVVLLGDRADARTVELERFLTRNSYPHVVVDHKCESLAHPAGFKSPVAATSFPCVCFRDGRVLQRPTIAALADEVGLMAPLDHSSMYDIAVVGAGPAGLSTAVYGASEGLSVVVIESVAPGGQAGTSSKIENYLGFPTGVSGLELATRAQLQAQKFGANLAISRDVVAIETRGAHHCLKLSCGAQIQSRAVVIATGATYARLSVDDYSRFEYRGIHYAATGMEAVLCRGKEVVVIGGGNSAGQAAVFLAEFAAHVHLLVRGDSIAESMSHYLVKRIEHSRHITLHANCEVERLEGSAVLDQVTWIHRSNGARESRRIGSMFVMIGAKPNTAWLGKAVRLDRNGFIVTGDRESFEDTPYATNVPGIYAVGDVRAGSIKRVASAVGEGSVVVSDVHRYLAARRSEIRTDPAMWNTLGRHAELVA